MLLQSLRALCKASGGPGRIWKYLEALVIATGVSGRLGCGFRTDLHFADVSPPNNERQQRVNDFWSCILDNLRAVQRHTPILKILATFIGKNASDNITTTS